MKFEEDQVVLTYEDAFVFLQSSGMAQALADMNIMRLEQKLDKTKRDFENERDWKEKKKTFEVYNVLLNSWFVDKLNKKYSGEGK